MNTHTDQSHRGSILIEDAQLLAMAAFANDQYVMQLKAPRIAAKATAGSFVHLSCATTLPMRRPLSIQRVDRSAGVLEVLFKVVGRGTDALAKQRVGSRLSCMGPIGNGFTLNLQRTRPLLIGGGVGIPPMIFLAEQLAEQRALKPFAIFGSEIPFPFAVRPSTIVVPALPAEVIGAHPVLEALNIPSRLCSLKGYAGCFEGYVTDLASRWLDALSQTEQQSVSIYACGPNAMLKAVCALAERYQIPAQVSLEEYMACAVGGCAGCVVKINTDTGPKMQRVCVDGPVFDAHRVLWNP